MLRALSPPARWRETDGRLRMNSRPRRGPSGEQRHRWGPAFRAQALRKDGPLLSLPWNPWSGSRPGVPRTQADSPSPPDLGGSSPALPFLALRLVGTECSIEPSQCGG